MRDTSGMLKEVRCWCRNQDYCNTDLSDRVDDDKELPANLVADEGDETTTAAADNGEEGIVIERNYDIKDELFATHGGWMHEL
ncbi:hypothetical protein GCK32_017897 [Trichostrongylus colubriformis]|uniref:Uncharacterized protein n=1 Tax=Trichostrongylus colubriformis TaxID=6319 RepID=A0AAN8I8Q5_TRICO